MSAGAAKEFAAHDVGDKVFHVDVAARSGEKGDFVGGKRGEKSGELGEIGERGVGKNGVADHGIAFEEDVAARGEFPEIMEIESLEIAPDIKNDVAVVGAKLINLGARTEMVVDAILFAGARIAGIVENERLKAFEEVRMKFGESFGKRALASARGTGENDEAAW